ncbi:MAG: hypothetical protein MHM6MM_004670 [Cercozoa sp. M6MM]
MIGTDFARKWYLSARALYRTLRRRRDVSSLLVLSAFFFLAHLWRVAQRRRAERLKRRVFLLTDAAGPVGWQLLRRIAERHGSGATVVALGRSARELRVLVDTWDSFVSRKRRQMRMSEQSEFAHFSNFSAFDGFRSESDASDSEDSVSVFDNFDSDDDDIEDVAQRMMRLNLPLVRFVVADLTDVALLKRSLRSVLREFGAVDVVVFHARVEDELRRRHIADLNGDALARLHAQVLRAWCVVTRECVPAMLDKHTYVDTSGGVRGHIITVASLLGVEPMHGACAGYAAVHSALLSLHRALRLDLELGQHVDDKSQVRPNDIATSLVIAAPVGERVHSLLPTTTAQSVADAVMHCVATGAAEVYAPRSLKLLVYLAMLMPTWLRFRIKKFGRSRVPQVSPRRQAPLSNSSTSSQSKNRRVAAIQSRARGGFGYTPSPVQRPMPSPQLPNERTL